MANTGWRLPPIIANARQHLLHRRMSQAYFKPMHGKLTSVIRSSASTNCHILRRTRMDSTTAWCITFNNWFGVEGEFDATHGNQSGFSSWFVAGYGGRASSLVRAAGIELWAHALIGYSHFTPQTARGPQHALAYEFGGGADLPFHPRWAIRVSA